RQHCAALRILERTTDLFAAGSRGYIGDQIVLFDDVLGELAADIEVQARARLAQRLAHINTSRPRLSARSPTPLSSPSRSSRAAVTAKAERRN
ncbi:MAG: hypothetical protein WBE71_17560, partial [Xanthobacteraceae bacterium]